MKKIAISTNAGQVYAHFGRAPEFTFVTIDEENKKLISKEVFPNPGHSVGSIPQFVNSKGADYMIAGGMGHRAVNFFNQFGIEVIVGVTGSVQSVIQKILDGTLEGGESLCAPGAGKGSGVEKIHTEADDKYPHNH
ncbi:MAG: dinitrogenase iron-molybdenum cofactor [Candidatus Lokiarchaeota archaeon]|nr:dinitrogenase iron-molybdenum cofactor [Candidatus Lokiarchaeota archaeon]MBD3338165.1 dinitrogenase iron-molybdenum cofactor [Candidatus Lokiarchaeota archaeon]